MKNLLVVMNSSRLFFHGTMKHIDLLPLRKFSSGNEILLNFLDAFIWTLSMNMYSLSAILCFGKGVRHYSYISWYHWI